MNGACCRLLRFREASSMNKFRRLMKDNRFTIHLVNQKLSNLYLI